MFYTLILLDKQNLSIRSVEVRRIVFITALRLREVASIQAETPR
jgi:hypothetical protein